MMMLPRLASCIHCQCDVMCCVVLCCRVATAAYPVHPSAVTLNIHKNINTQHYTSGELRPCPSSSSRPVPSHRARSCRHKPCLFFIFFYREFSCNRRSIYKASAAPSAGSSTMSANIARAQAGDSSTTRLQIKGSPFPPSTVLGTRRQEGGKQQVARGQEGGMKAAIHCAEA